MTTFKAHDDAVGRRPANGEAAIADAPQPDRIRERQCMRYPGLVGLRCDDPYLVGEAPGDPLGGIEARCVDTVVVGNEDFHDCACSTGLWIER
jgi:hypothetical protein